MNWMNNIIATALCAFFGWVVFQVSQNEWSATTTQLAQLGISAAGAFMFGYEGVKPLLKGLTLRKLFPEKKKEKQEEKDSDCEIIYMEDVEALTHLKNRLHEVDSEEGVRMIVEINNILFSSVCGEQDYARNEEVPF